MKPRFNSLHEWLEWQESLHWTDIDLGLDRLREVAGQMQLLDPPFSIITVAGTNGKGSTVAMLDAMLLAEGYKTGTYTSPYLYRYNERIRISAKEVGDKLLCDAFHAVDIARGDISLTYFEFATLAAIWIFKQQNVQLAILEVGMGGRLDAVNLWDCDVGIITSIGIDHVKWLGDNREDIGREKAGIMRPNHPVISCDPNPPQSISKYADEVQAILYQAGNHFSWKIRESDWDQQIKKESVKLWENLPKPRLQGDFQINNAAGAITALYALASNPAAEFKITDESIHKGLKRVKLSGRLELIQQHPEILLDVAHNAHAAKELANWLAANPPQGKTYALFSMLDDKDVSEVVVEMKEVVDIWFVSGINDPRGLNAEDLVEKMPLNDKGSLKVKSFKHLDLAWNACKKQANRADRIIVFGSFLVLSEFKVIF